MRIQDFKRSVASSKKSKELWIMVASWEQTLGWKLLLWLLQWNAQSLGSHLCALSVFSRRRLFNLLLTVWTAAEWRQNDALIIEHLLELFDAGRCL